MIAIVGQSIRLQADLPNVSDGGIADLTGQLHHFKS